MLDTAPHVHYIDSITTRVNEHVLHCRTLKKTFESITKILCESSCEFDCLYDFVLSDDLYTHYTVVIPFQSETGCNFYIAHTDGKKIRAWKPGRIDFTSLPEGFYFTRKALNLSYEPHIRKFKDLQKKSAKTVEAALTKLSYDNEHLIISGYLFIPASLQKTTENACLHIIKFRQEEIRFSFNIELENIGDEELVFGNRKVSDYRMNGDKVIAFTTSIDANKFVKSRGLFNFFIEYESQNIKITNYFKRYEGKDYLFSKKISFFRTLLMVPYLDDGLNIWRLDLYNLNFIEWIRLRLLYRKQTRKACRKNKNIWLIGEYPNTARDNGLHFFQYLQKEHPEIQAYYVIEKDAPDSKKLQGNVLTYGSYKHFRIAAEAKILAFTQVPNFIVPKINHITNFQNKYSAYHTVFLQHGVIATTAGVTRIHQRRQRMFSRFVVSSLFEKSIICKYLGYKENEVIVTGLSRWDSLLKKSHISSEILVMPTWRNDLDKTSASTFKQSGFYTFWNELLHHGELQQILKEKGFSINFFLHIGLERFSTHFHFPENIRCKNRYDIQELLSSCPLLITDYSSVAFDVLLQNKPVIFCPFDYEDMMNLRPGPQFINYEKDLPGPVCYDVEQTANSIISAIKNKFSLEEKYQKRRLKFFASIDQKNCERLYSEIKKLSEST